MGTYIQPDDVTILDVGGVSTPEVVAKWIDKAERRLRALLRARGVTLATLAEDPDRLDDIRDVLENAVLRVLRNPDGASSESEGDYSITVNPLDSAGNIWFPAADLNMLAPAASSVGTINLSVPAYRMPNPDRFCR